MHGSISARRAIFVATILLGGIALAGCVADTAVDAQTTPGDVADLPALRVTSVLATPGRGEPSLGVTPDGVLFTNMRAGVFRSADGGASWEALGNPLARIPDFDPDLVVDVDGTVWFDVLYLACNAVAVSRDQGESWTQHPAVCNGPVGDRQYVIPTEGGEAFLYYHQLPTFQQTAMRTTDHGRTWAPTGPMEPLGHHLLVNKGSGWGGGGFWNRAQDSVWATYTWFQTGPVRDGGPQAPEAWRPAASVTRDDTTWELVLGPEPAGRSVGLSLVVGAADDAGNVYLAWVEARDGPDGNDDMAVMLAASRDDGRTWGTPVRVDAGSGSHVLPAIASGPDGKVVVAYYEADVDGYPAALAEDAQWRVTLAATDDAFAGNVSWTRMNASDHVVKRGVICPDGASCDGDREFLDYFQVRRMPDGRVGMVYNSMHAADKDGLATVFAMTETAFLA